MTKRSTKVSRADLLRANRSLGRAVRGLQKQIQSLRIDVRDCSDQVAALARAARYDGRLRGGLTGSRRPWGGQ